MKRRPSRKSPTGRSQNRLESLCGSVGPDDGIDPRKFCHSDPVRRNSRKDWQLCRQVFETLNYVLSGESHDEILRSLAVHQVQPAPDASRLLVTVGPIVPGDKIDPAAALRRLHESVGRLRSEVARSISRRKVPELALQFVESVSTQPPQPEIRHES